MIIDSHAHLNDSAYDTDRDEVVKRTLKNGVWMINVGYNEATSMLAVELAGKYPEGVFASVAMHPHSAKEGFNSETYRGFFKNNKVVAIGETGLDFNELYGKLSEEDKNLQRDIFKKHIELAIELNKPLIIHCSKAHDEILEILRSYALNHKSRIRGVAHSFLGNYKQARHYRELGFKLGFNGIITYARDYDKVILDTPIEDILIETDCPFLTPVPYRGERNEPLYVAEVAKKLAELKQISYEEIVRITTENARKLFGI